MTFIQAIIKNPTRSIERPPKGSATVTTQGQVLAWATGLLVPADSSTVKATLAGVCNESITAAQAITTVSMIDLFPQDVWIADVTNNSNAAHDGQFMVLTDSLTVNNTGTTSATGIVQQVGVYGAAADKKILVKFVTN